MEAIDKEKQTVTIKGPKRTLTVHVRDPKKLEAIKVGDPVVGKYYEALAIEVKKPGTATPGRDRPARRGHLPTGRDTGRRRRPAGHRDRDHRRNRQEGGHGDHHRRGHRDLKARDPKNLEAVKVGDLVEITYTRALAIALDKSAAK